MPVPDLGVVVADASDLMVVPRRHPGERGLAIPCAPRDGHLVFFRVTPGASPDAPPASSVAIDHRLAAPNPPRAARGTRKRPNGDNLAPRPDWV